MDDHVWTAHLNVFPDERDEFLPLPRENPSCLHSHLLQEQGRVRVGGWRWGRGSEFVKGGHNWLKKGFRFQIQWPSQGAKAVTSDKCCSSWHSSEMCMLCRQERNYSSSSIYVIKVLMKNSRVWLKINNTYAILFNLNEQPVGSYAYEINSLLTECYM